MKPLLSKAAMKVKALNAKHRIHLEDSKELGGEQVVYLISSKGFLQYLENRRVEK